MRQPDRPRFQPGDHPVPPPELWDTPPKGAVLVLAPHQDDETFGCGGAILMHRRQGDPVTVVFVTKGDKGDPNGYYADVDYVALREREARAACARLGVGEVRFLGLPDGFGVDDPGRVGPLTGAIRALLDELRPKTVYYPWIGETHPDHFQLARAVEGAAVAIAPRESPGNGHAGASGEDDAILFLGYELWSVHLPDAVLDISEVVEEKIAAARLYESQLRYTDYLQPGRGLMAYRALYLAQRGSTYAEAFLRYCPAPASPPRPEVPARPAGGLLRRLFGRGGAG